MKLHIRTHPWLHQCTVLVDFLDVSKQCRGIDLETRTLYMVGHTKLGDPDPWNPPDLEVTLGVTERLRLMLDGREVLPLGDDPVAAVAKARELVADAHADLGKLPSSEVLGYLLTGLEDALADPDAAEPQRSLCLHPVLTGRPAVCADCGAAP